METTEQQGFVPDSAYASWDDEERAASDRVEAYFEHQRRTILATANQGTIRGLGDAGLRRIAKAYQRQIEDIEDGDQAGALLQTKGRSRGMTAIRALNIKLRDIEREQDFRAALAESWMATEEGTHSYTSFEARGGLEAVLHHGAKSPSYDLAVTLDWEQWKRGGSHVLVWDSQEAKAA